MSTSKREKTKQQLAFKRCVRCILSYGLCFTIVTFLFVYAFFHYDQETEKNTYTVKTYITTFSLLTSRHGGITIQLETESGMFYYDAYYNSWAWNSVKDEKQKLTDVLQQLVDSQNPVVITVSDEKNYAYVMSYGFDALQAVEIRSSNDVIFSSDGHNKDQRIRKIETIIVACVVLIVFISYHAVRKYLKV